MRSCTCEIRAKIQRESSGRRSALLKAEGPSKEGYKNPSIGIGVHKIAGVTKPSVEHGCCCYYRFLEERQKYVCMSECTG